MTKATKDPKNGRIWLRTAATAGAIGAVALIAWKLGTRDSASGIYAPTSGAAVVDPTSADRGSSAAVPGPARRAPGPTAAGSAPSAAGARSPSAGTASLLDRAPRRVLSGQSARDPYDHAPVLGSETSTPDADGTFKRIRLVKSDGKYPLVRVEELYNRDPATGEERFVKRVAMVADHFMLTLESGFTEGDLRNAAEGLGVSIRKPVPLTDIYLVSFDANRDLQSFGQVLDRLRRSRLTRIAEPDYIVSVN